MKDLVLFWGWSRGDSSYKKLVESAPEGWNIFIISTPTLIPIGDTPRLNKNILQFLANNNLHRAYFCGHSLGGAIALEFAYHHPEVIEHLYLADSEGVYESTHPARLVFNAFYPGPGGRRHVLEDVESLLRIMKSPALNTKLARHAHKASLLAEARDLKVPTTILWGEKDRLTPLSQGRKLHELIPRSQLIVLPGEGHDWIMHKPELFWQNITKTSLSEDN